MRWISNLVFRLRATLAPGKMERDLSDEMAFHLEMEGRKLVAQGMSPAEAQRQARRTFGEPLREKERARESWGIGLVHDLRSDARHTLRSLRGNPVFSVVTVLTLALGIGGTTAIFSVVNGVLIKPLPYPGAGELVSVHHVSSTASIDAIPLSPALYFTFRDHARTLREIGLYWERDVTVTGLDRPERVEALLITDGLFPVLGLQPMLGRGFLEEDVTPGSTNPVILTHGYWQRRFGGDPAILGRTLRLEGTELQIVGVMPPHLRLPGVRAELFLPLVFDRARIGIGNFSFPGIARLNPGVTPEEATRELDGLTVVATEEWGGFSLEELKARNFTSFVRPLRDTVIRGANAVLWVVFGTVCTVLLIACANVANLFLVRAEARQRDVALRAALGASGGRLARHSLTESLFVGLLGGLLGLFLAAGGIRFLLSLAPTSIPRLDDIGLDPLALLFALGASVLTGLLCGSIPVFRLRRGSLADPLKDGGRGSSSGKRRFRLRTVFAVAQVAMSLVLLLGSGLMVRTFQALREVPPGFEDPQDVLTLRVAVPPSEIPDVDEATMMHQAILDRIGHLPGVISASGAASVAMEDWESWDDWMVEEFPLAEGEVEPNRRMNWMVPGYHETLHNRVLAGRTLEWEDIFERRNVVVVTENFANEYWGAAGRALGKRIRNSASSPWREIVGVAGNVHTAGVSAQAPLVVYLPFITANFWGSESFCVRELRYVIRTDGPDPLSLMPAVRQAVWSENPNLALSDVKILDEIFGQSIARTSFTLVMLVIAAGAALILGLVGVYGVISYIVSQRTQEVGVRMALGATQRDVSLLVLRQGGTMAITGVAVGLGAAAGLTRFMSGLLFGVGPLDPLTFGAVSTALAGVVLLASYLPARRAAGVDPTEALRWE
ncbi:ADOP family duplicated permease [Gemmatimonadota bacterium]